MLGSDRLAQFGHRTFWHAVGPAIAMLLVLVV